MIDFKRFLQKGFWLEKKQALETAIHPYLAPAVSWYRAYSAKHPKKGRVLKWGGLLGGGGFAVLFLCYLMLLTGLFGRMPSRKALRNLNQNIASEVYSEDGVLLGKYYIENRLPSDLQNVSSHIVNALVSTEDARFFEHGGVDFRATMRVLFRSLLKGDETGGGGSTISQQLAKNLYPRKKLGPLTMPVAKFREIIIARRLESVYDKNGILALYLNTVPFGENAFGIKVAAKRYFDTTPEDIKIENAAVLIGMLKGTTAYNPARNPERAKERRNTVMAQMVKYGYLDSLAFDSLKQLPLILKFSTESHDEGMATYFRENLRLELEQELKKYTHPDGRPYNLYTDGLKIYTTINSKMQQHAEDAVKEHMKEVQKTFIQHFRSYPGSVSWGSDELLEQQKKLTERYRNLKDKGLSEAEIDSNFNTPVKMTVFSWDTGTQDRDTTISPLDSLKYYLGMLNTGLLATDPKTGKIMAWVGGINFKYFKYDHIKALRQVGSTFKPVVYAKALEQGIGPCERFPNEFRVYKEYDNWAPRNVDGLYGGSYSMRGALRMSVNSIAVQLIMRVGIDSVIDLAKKMGITSKIAHEPGIALGAVDATLLEMVRLFSVFANQGVVPRLYSLTRIETNEGEVLADFKAPDPKTFPRALQAHHADVIRYLLQAVVDGGTGGRLRYLCNFIYPAGGKTGTTDNNSDGWFIGFTPDVVAGAWVGAQQPLVRWRSTRLGQGGVTALPVAGKFLAKVYNDPAFKSWQKNNFPNLTGTDAGSLNCSDYIPADSILLDSLYSLEQIHPDSISEEERQRLIDEIKNIFRAFGKDSLLEKRDPDTGPDGGDISENDDDLSKESERIQRQNERLEKKRERQKKRKEFLEELFGKKKG